MKRDWQADVASASAEWERTTKRWRWEIAAYVSSIVLGDREWGSLRYYLMIAGAVLFLLFGRVTEAIEPRPWVGELTALATPALQPAAHAIMAFVDTMLTRQALRHALPPVAGFFVAILLGARFVNDLFELGDVGLANRYLQASLFGKNYAFLNIRDCRIDASQADNPLVKIGGPGYVQVGVGLAAVCETAGGPADVLGTGRHFLRRFESLREVFDLRDQFRTIPDFTSYTRDGILVLVKDASVSFRMRTRHNQPRTPKEPYPFSIEALRDAAYERVVGREGAPSWPEAVVAAVTGRLDGLIARRRLDELIGPAAANARESLLLEFYKGDSRSLFGPLGADIRWVSLGHFVNPHEVAAQRIRTWQSTWQMLDKITEAEAQAERLRLEERLRGEEVEQLVHAIEHGGQFLEDAGMTPADRFFVLLAETLEAYAKRSRQIGQSDAEMTQLAREMRRATGASTADPNSLGGANLLDQVIG